MQIFFDGIIYSWQKGGGVYRYFEEIIAECCNRKNLEVTLLIHLPSYVIPAKKNILFTHILKSPYVPWFSFKLLRKLLSPMNKMGLERYFKERENGIFHSTYYTTYKNLRIPQVLTVHDMTHEKFPLFFASSGAKRFIANKKRCIEKADSIICVSNATKKALIDTYGIDDKKISVVHHGLSTNFVSEAEIPTEYLNILKKEYFLFVGNRGLYKNFDFFIKSFLHWNKNKGYNLVLVGGGSLSKDELKIIKHFGMEEHVKYLGFVDEKYLKYIYSRSKAFIFPSLDEGFGFPILEAISSKTQVLASDIEAFKEIGESMLTYFNPRNSESLLAALDQSLLSKTTKEEFESRAKYVISKYSWNTCVDKTLEVYHKTTNEKTH